MLSFWRKLAAFGYINSGMCAKKGEGNGCPENPMDGGAWWAAVHGVTKSQTQLSDFTFTFHFHALEKEMATHSSFLAWRIPWTEKPGRLQSMGSHRVRHDWSDLAAASGMEKCGCNFIVNLFALKNNIGNWHPCYTDPPKKLQPS